MTLILVVSVESWTSKSAFLSPHCQLFKNVLHESSELNFIWGKMRTTAWETAPQIALRNCSKEAIGKGQYIRDFGEGGVHTIKHIILQISTSHSEQSPP